MKVKNELKLFFDEKNLESDVFEIEHNGNVHFVESEVVIDLILCSPEAVQKTIQSTLIKLDFFNSNINNYLRHLAEGYVKTNY